MNPVEALSGRAGLAGLRWLLVDPEPQGALRRELSALFQARLNTPGTTLGRSQGRRWTWQRRFPASVAAPLIP